MSLWRRSWRRFSTATRSGRCRRSSTRRSRITSTISLPKTCVRYVYRAGSVRATTRSILATNCLRGLSALHPDRGPAKPRVPTAQARDCTEDRGRSHSLPMRPSLGPLSYFRKSEKPGRRARKSSVERFRRRSTGRSAGVSLDQCREFT